MGGEALSAYNAAQRAGEAVHFNLTSEDVRRLRNLARLLGMEDPVEVVRHALRVDEFISQTRVDGKILVAKDKKVREVIWPPGV